MYYVFIEVELMESVQPVCVPVQRDCQQQT